MSNPLSLADAVVLIQQERTYLKEAPIFSREESDAIDNKLSAYDQVLNVLARVTEPAELRAEVERLKAEMATMIKIPDAGTSIPFRKSWENEDGSFEPIMAPGTWEPKLLEETKE